MMEQAKHVIEDVRGCQIGENAWDLYLVSLKESFHLCATRRKTES